MAYQAVGVGTVANDGTGDQLRSAFIKINSNFVELYAKTGAIFSTVGSSGADYTTVYAAYAAGKRYIKLITDVTETQSPAINANFIIDGLATSGNRYTLTCNYALTGASFANTLIINDCIIASNYTGAAATPFMCSLGTFIFENIKFTLTNASQIFFLNSAGSAYANTKFENVQFSVANISNFINMLVQGVWNDVNFIGGGASALCSATLINSSTNYFFINGLIIDSQHGTSVSSSGSNAFINGTNIFINNMIDKYTGGGAFQIHNAKLISHSVCNLRLAVATTYKITDSDITIGQTTVANASLYADNCTVSFTASGSTITLTLLSLINCVTTGLLGANVTLTRFIMIGGSAATHIVTLATKRKYSNVQFTAVITFTSGSNMTFDGCDFDNQLSITGSYNILSSCIFANTLTVAGSNNKILNNYNTSNTSVTGNNNIINGNDLTGVLTLGATSTLNKIMYNNLIGGLTDSSGLLTNEIKYNN